MRVSKCDWLYLNQSDASYCISNCNIEIQPFYPQLYPANLGKPKSTLHCGLARRISSAVYVGDVNVSGMRFRWVKVPTRDELTRLTHTISQRVARFLKRQGLLGRDCENRDLAANPVQESP